MNTAIILAAGISKRFGGNTPKQYLKINDKEIIDYSIDVFTSSKYIDKIIVVVSEEFVSILQKRYPSITIVKGGKTRQDSSYLGLCACSDKTNFVLIHDAARIFVNDLFIKNCINALKKYNAVTIASKITDTIAKHYNNEIVKMENRAELIAIQTPQGFNYKKLLHSHKKFNGEATDDIRIMLENGYKCNFIITNKINLKITNNNDYLISSGIINNNKYD